MFMAVVRLEGQPMLPSGRIRWHAEEKKMDADIQGMSLERILGQLARSSGWRVLLQPGSSRPVYAKFRGADRGEALRLILGDLNYALLPQAEGGSELRVYKTIPTAATQVILPGDPKMSKDWLSREVLVSLSPDSKINIDDLAKKLGGKVVGRADDMKSYRLEFETDALAEAARKALAEMDGVRVDDNFTFRRPEESIGNTPTGKTDGEFRAAKTADGDCNTVVAMLDTTVGNQRQYLTQNQRDFLLPSISVAGEPNPDASELSHGPAMLESIINGAKQSGGTNASKMRILPIDVYGNKPSTSSFELAKGVNAALQNKANVVNISSGGSSDSAMLNDILAFAKNQGILVFASAGNEPTTDPVFPAANPNVLAVTASDREGGLAAYANRGPFVDLMLPGSSRVQYGGQDYIVNGTSPASATASGLAAGLIDCGTPNQGAVVKAMQQAFPFK